MKEILSPESKGSSFRDQEEDMLAPTPRIIVRRTGLAYDMLLGSPTTSWRDPSGQVHTGIVQHYDVIYVASGRSFERGGEDFATALGIAQGALDEFRPSML